MLSVTFATSTWSRNFDDTKHGGMNAKHNKVQRLYDTRTVKPYGKTISILSGYEPRLVDKPVQIKVEYARPRFISATNKTEGFKSAFEKLKGQLTTEFGSAVQISGGPGRTSSFEIYANSELIHSKLGGSAQKLDTSDTPIWTNAECKALFAKVRPLTTGFYNSHKGLMSTQTPHVL